MSVTIEKDGRVLRGLALPFGEIAIVVDSRGEVFGEVFDSVSLAALPRQIPLLVSHNRDNPPAGKVIRTSLSERGLELEAELIGSDDELEGWRRKFAAGLMAALSVAFRADRPVWEKPPEKGLPPIKRVRGAQIEEISLVSWPAYKSATLDRVSLRSLRDEKADLEKVLAAAAGPSVVERAAELLARRRS